MRRQIRYRDRLYLHRLGFVRHLERRIVKVHVAVGVDHHRALRIRAKLLALGDPLSDTQRVTSSIIRRTTPT